MLTGDGGAGSRAPGGGLAATDKGNQLMPSGRKDSDMISFNSILGIEELDTPAQHGKRAMSTVM